MHSTVVFGDVHLHWKAVKVILDHARGVGIEKALTLGDEANAVFPQKITDWEEIARVWHELKAYRDEKNARELVCTLGDKTDALEPDIFRNFVGVDAYGRRPNRARAIIHERQTEHENVLAGHRGEDILKAYGPYITYYRESCDQRLPPLVIFHGHSHSMGVLSEYKFLHRHEFVDHVAGEERYELENGKVYWVNPGAQFHEVRNGHRLMAANFAVYEPRGHVVTLKTLLYDPERIQPSQRFSEPRRRSSHRARENREIAF